MNDAARDPAPRDARTMVHIVTVPPTLFFLSGQPTFLRDRCGITVHAISAPGPGLTRFGEQQGVAVHAVAMGRRITPVSDLLALWQIWRILRRVRPRIVHAHTPKGGLLGMLAAWLARVPVRVYHLHGLPLVTATGSRRYILRWAERVSCSLAHRVLAVSHSIRRIAVEEGLCAEEKIKVLLDGSVNGVDANRFRPATLAERAATRAQLALGPDDQVIGFVGRVAREKGIAELADAWVRLREKFPRLHLLVVGRLDAADPPPSRALASLQADPRVRFVGQVRDTVPVYAAMDVVALPTYREGFGNVAIEAGAMGLPIVATMVSGCLDSVQDGVTGTLVPARDSAALADALARYLSDAMLRGLHGQAGRSRVLASFRREPIWEALAAEYEALLTAAPALS